MAMTNFDFRGVLNNLLFFTGTLYVLDMTGVDEVITNAIGVEGNASTLKRALASAVILETVVLVGKAVEDTSLDRLKNLLQ